MTGYAKRCLVYLWVSHIVNIFLGLLIRKFDKVSGRLSFHYNIQCSGRKSHENSSICVP